MLTALHITLPKGRDTQRIQHEKHLPNRCLVANETTREVSLMSTEASVKYANCAATNERQDGGTRFRFHHIAISPHHGSIFVTQVAPLLYDLCRTFRLASNKGRSGSGSGTTAEFEPQLATLSNLSTSRTTQPVLEGVSTGFCQTLPRQLQSLNRTVFVYGSHSTTDRRALFLHLAKRTAQVLLQQMDDASSSERKGGAFCKVSLSIVDLYHAWGVGDLLDPSAVLHDGVKLESLRREKPRRSLNEPKGIAFVTPTQQTLENYEHASQCILRALQHADSPRALRTDAEREDHAVKSTLVLSFTLSKRLNGEEEEEEEEEEEKKNGDGGGWLPRRQIDAKLLSVSANEARVHLILLPDSTAAAHGKQVAQELGALACALQACSAQRQDSGHNTREDAPSHGVNGIAANIRTMGNGGKYADLTTPSSTTSWAPLRESPLLLYLFESTVYYAHQLDRSLRHLRVAVAERRRQRHQYGNESKSVSANTSAYSRSTTESRCASTFVSAEYGSGVVAEENCSHIVDCIASGIGKCIVVLCVNSGWDQYYQARSAFLFVQRVTNQLGPPRNLAGLKMVGMNSQAVGLQEPTPTPNTWIHSPCVHHSDPQHHHQQGRGRGGGGEEKREGDEGGGKRKKSSLSVQGTSGVLEMRSWLSPPRREKTEPRPLHQRDSPLSPQAPSDVSILDDESNVDSNDGRNGRDAFHPVERVLLTSPLVKKENSPQKHVAPVSESVPEPNHPPYSSRWRSDIQGPLRKFLHRGNRQQGMASGDTTNAVTPSSSASLPVSRHHPYAPEGGQEEEEETGKNVEKDLELTSPELTRMHAVEMVGAQLSLASCVSSSPTKCTVPGVLQEVESDVMNALVEKQGVLRDENQRLRALVSQLLLREADGVVKQRGVTGIIDLCDAGVVPSRMAISSSKLAELQKNLSSATKKVQALKRSLSRSMDENRKMRRAINHHLQQCLTHLPRVLHDAVAEGAITAPNIAEERICRWEKLLESSTQHILQMMREGACGKAEEEEEDEKEELIEGVESPGDSYEALGSQWGQRKESVDHHLLDSQDTHTRCRRQEQRRRRSLSCSEGAAARWPPNLKTAEGRSLGDTIDAQELEMLRIASFLFLGEAPTDKATSGAPSGLRKLLDEDKKRSCGGAQVSFSRSILDVFSPRRSQEQEQEQELPVTNGGFAGVKTLEQNLCWKCHANRCTRRNTAYTRFIELLRSLCARITPDGVLHHGLAVSHGGSQGITTSTTEPSQGVCEPAPAPLSSRFSSKLDEVSTMQNEAALLMHARQLSTSLQQRTDARQSERAFMQQMESELRREREWRRELQDEVLQLRLRVRKYEAKFLFIDETLKPRLSNGIEELEQLISQRSRQSKLEKEQRASFISEVKSRLRSASEAAHLKPNISSSTPCLP